MDTSNICYGWFSEMASKEMTHYQMDDTDYLWKNNPEYGVEGLYYIHAETGKMVEVTNISLKEGENDNYCWDDKVYVGPVEKWSGRIMAHHDADEHNKYIINN